MNDTSTLNFPSQLVVRMSVDDKAREIVAQRHIKPGVAMAQHLDADFLHADTVPPRAIEADYIQRVKNLARM